MSDQPVEQVTQQQFDPYDPPLEVQEVVEDLQNQIGKLSGELSMTKMRLKKVQTTAREREASLNQALQELAAQLASAPAPHTEPGDEESSSEEQVTTEVKLD